MRGRLFTSQAKLKTLPGVREQLQQVEQLLARLQL